MQSSRDAFAWDLAAKNRCTLKNENPLIAERLEKPRKNMFERSLHSREDEILDPAFSFLSDDGGPLTVDLRSSCHPIISPHRHPVMLLHGISS